MSSTEPTSIVQPRSVGEETSAQRDRVGKIKIGPPDHIVIETIEPVSSVSCTWPSSGASLDAVDELYNIRTARKCLRNNASR